MGKKIYFDKLVRDRIPDLLQKRGIICSCEILDDFSFEKALRRKLQEEISEYFAAKTSYHRAEELADILEVIHALAEKEGLSFDAVEKFRMSKAEEKGAFSRRLFLKNGESCEGDQKESSCLFCSMAKRQVPANIVATFTHCYALFDEYPVTKGHLLLIPYEHTENWFTAGQAVREDIVQAIDQMKSLLDGEYSPDGYNIGMNCGTSAGQSVMHLHVHLIPRYLGDVDNPFGGVRGVIPDKQNYRK